MELEMLHKKTVDAVTVLIKATKRWNRPQSCDMFHYSH